jgi:hypothetical protein
LIWSNSSSASSSSTLGALPPLPLLPLPLLPLLVVSLMVLLVSASSSLPLDSGDGGGHSPRAMPCTFPAALGGISGASLGNHLQGGHNAKRGSDAANRPADHGLFLLNPFHTVSMGPADRCRNRKLLWGKKKYERAVQMS